MLRSKVGLQDLGRIGSVAEAEEKARFRAASLVRWV